jgi:hypothetical protein
LKIKVSHFGARKFVVKKEIRFLTFPLSDFLTEKKPRMSAVIMALYFN